MDTVAMTQFKVPWTRYKEFTRFITVIAGVISREIYHRVSQGANYHFAWVDLTLALMGALVTFPTLERILDQDTKMSDGMQFLIAFQYGFSWKEIIGLGMK
jgi:hypothetical protein